MAWASDMAVDHVAPECLVVGDSPQLGKSTAQEEGKTLAALA